MCVVLVATPKGQGRRETDFCLTREGELVMFPFAECMSEPIDAHCGCRRMMIGVDSMKGTTTFRVAKRHWGTAKLRSMIIAWLKKEGIWAFWEMEGKTFKECRSLVDHHIARMNSVALNFPLGTILERRGKKIQERRA